jgi:sodium transport system permease protein
MIYTIFKKELIDTLRDRRTLTMMLVIPLLVFPISLNIFTRISDSFESEAANKPIKIGMVGTAENYIQKELMRIPEGLGKKEIVFFKDTSSMQEKLKMDSIQLGVLVPVDVLQKMANFQPANITIYYNATDMGMQERAKMYMEIIENSAKVARLNQLKIDEKQVTPLEISYNNVATDKEMIGKLAGGILPYIFLAFGFIGCMYPAIDLFTGEKERGTIETLLTTPIARWKILIGKMSVVVLSGITAASFSLIGLFIAIEFIDLKENVVILDVIHSILSPSFIAMIYVLLVPLTVFFAGVMVPIAIHAKSFKEAQSIITPLNILLVLPAMVGFFPGIELNYTTACIPIVNIVLATKELIAGTLDFNMVVLSFLVMVVFAGIAVLISYKRFDREENVLA